MHNRNEDKYLDLLHTVYTEGTRKPDRTDTGTFSVFGTQTRYKLQDGFPLLTTKKMFWRGIVEELLWFLSGDTNVRSLQRKGVHFWDEWADQYGDLGSIYGKQWRKWNDWLDQISETLLTLKSNPLSRRHLVTAWNPADIKFSGLPPCHIMFQFYAEPLRTETLKDVIGQQYRLSMQVYQRSGDLFLGVPFNVASYALLLRMFCAELNMEPGDLIHTIGDAHIYTNHLDQVSEQLKREPYEPPKVQLSGLGKGVGGFPGVLNASRHNIQLFNYSHHPKIEAPVAV